MRTDYSIKPLAAAVIAQAVRDARKGDAQAREWLRGDGLLWLSVCGIDYDREQIDRRLRRAGKLVNKIRTRTTAAIA